MLELEILTEGEKVEKSHSHGTCIVKGPCSVLCDLEVIVILRFDDLVAECEHDH